MEYSAFYHRPESEYAYLYTSDTAHIRIRSKKGDVDRVTLICCDPYDPPLDSFKRELNMDKIYQTKTHDYWQVSVSPSHKRLQYIFRLEDEVESVLFTDTGVLADNQDNINEGWNYFKIPYFHQADMAKVPQWAKETVWYQIFPERFSKGDESLDPDNVRPWDYEIDPTPYDFFGGDLQGIIDKLDYLQDLGITGLYFCPIFEASSNHKYDTIDYYSIDKHFGDHDTFRTLVKEAKARGMKIMLDAVFNHIGSHSPQFQDVIKNGKKSKYYDWFYIYEWPIPEPVTTSNSKEDLPYDMFAYSSNMPKFNTSNKEVKEHLINIAKYWVEEYDIDAWRLDVANEVDHAFWKELHKELIEIKPDFYLIGEVWHSARSWLEGDEFHGVMNYALTDPIKQHFLEKRIDQDEFVSRISEQLMRYRKQTSEVMLNLIDSHDTARMRTFAGGNLSAVKTGLTFMFLLIGAPCIYYGTEIGMEGEHDPGCRKVMPWDWNDEQRDMYSFTKKLIKLRKDIQDKILESSLSLDVVDGLVRLTYHKDGEVIVAAYFKADGTKVEVESEYQALTVALSHNAKVLEDSFELEEDGFVVLV